MKKQLKKKVDGKTQRRNKKYNLDILGIEIVCYSSSWLVKFRIFRQSKYKNLFPKFPGKNIYNKAKQETKKLKLNM